MSVESTRPELGSLDPALRRIGTVLDEKWTLDRLLGVGGMAAVYAATHRNGARAAIKLFPFSVTTSAASAERILREGYLANRIGHPAIVRVLDDHLDRDHEYAYLVMELLDGETARQRIQRLGPMTPLDATRHLIALADCLVAAHERGVVHRDIKPENLFFTREGQLKVLDFGVARALDSAATITRTGATLGTPAYMSPEQARGKSSEISTPTDIYSAGATLLFLLTGEFLHEGETSQEIMVRAAWTPARPVKERGFGIPDCLVTLIDRACEFDPKNRYPSAAALRDALEGVLAELEHSPHATKTAPRPAHLSVDSPKIASTSALTKAAGEPTVAEASAAEDTTHRSRATERSRFWVGGVLTLALIGGVALVWPRTTTSPSSDDSRRTVSEPKTTATPPPSEPAATPPPPVPQENAPPPPIPVAPGSTDAPAARRVSKTTPAKTSGTTSRTATTVKESPRPASTVRDIGY